jgi:glycosyltransferase involved in cell wall biosynthesis
MNPSVSAIIPAWNATETIGRAIDSILAQTWGEVEIVVVDDGSTDDTPQVIARDYPQVKLIIQENAGPCVARNKGAFASSGELIAFLDSDDEWTPDKLEVQVAAMQAHPEIDMLGTNGWRTVGEMRYTAMPPWPPGRKLMRATVADVFSERHPMAN